MVRVWWYWMMKSNLFILFSLSSRGQFMHFPLRFTYRQQLGDGSCMVMLNDPGDFEKLYRAVGKYPQRTQIQLWKDIRDQHALPYGVITE